jgi:hypothetical protein
MIMASDMQLELCQIGGRFRAYLKFCWGLYHLNKSVVWSICLSTWTLLVIFSQYHLNLDDIKKKNLAYWDIDEKFAFFRAQDFTECYAYNCFNYTFVFATELYTIKR